MRIRYSFGMTDHRGKLVAIARAVGRSVPLVWYQIVLNRSMYTETAETYARALGCTVDEFLATRRMLRAYYSARRKKSSRSA